MDECFIRDRIDELRRARGVSEARMSLDIGRTKSYIQNIRCGKSNPSLEALTDICDYFGITLGEFFDREKEIYMIFFL